MDNEEIKIDKPILIGYSKIYDARYDKITGEWLESKCYDIDCEFCLNRPDKAFYNE